jgi:hypothetical protein
MFGLFKSAPKLSGQWSGRYEYDDWNRPAHFTVKITELKGRIAGHMIENNEFVDFGPDTLTAVIFGYRRGHHIQFTKEYEAHRDEHNHQLFYRGRLSKDGQQIIGYWVSSKDGDWTGSYTMEMTSADA